MFTQANTSQSSGITTHGLFCAANTNDKNDSTRWQVIFSNWWSTVLINRKRKTLLGLGRKPFTSHSYEIESKKIWTIPLRPDLPIKQIAAGTSHFLILYENGLMECCGNGNSGQLGIGYYRNSDADTLAVILPNGEIPISISAGEYYSLVISDAGTLYGFGDNQYGQIGLGANIRSVAFPTPVPLPAGSLAERIYTGHDKTIVICRGGEIYGFGSNSNKQFGKIENKKNGYFDVEPPLRLHQFESLKPKDIAIGAEAIIVLSDDGHCYIFGAYFRWPFDVVEINDLRIICLPPQLKVRQISFSYEHLLITSDQNELLGISSSRVTEQVRSGSDMGFERIILPNNKQVKSAVAGQNTTFIFDTDDNCFVMGCNDYNQLGLETIGLHLQPKEVNLDNLDRRIIHDIVRGKMPIPIVSPLEKLFSEQMYPAFYQENSDIFQVIENDPDQLVEINRPSGHGKSLLLSMLNSFYTRGNQHPVILLDLRELNMESRYHLSESYDAMMAKLYIKYRSLLFNGVLVKEDFERDSYQQVTIQKYKYFNKKNQLLKMCEYLFRQFGKKVILLIDNADNYQRFCPELDKRKMIEALLKECIAPVIGNAEGCPYVLKTIITAVHPTLFTASDATFKKIHGVLDRDSAYAAFLSNKYDEHPFSMNAVLDDLSVNSNDCLIIADVLAGKTINMSITPEHIGTLIREGILLAEHMDTSILSIKYSNQEACQLLTRLLRKWQIQNMQRVTVILDVDELLAVHGKCNESTRLYFLKKGYIITSYNITHYILPGVIELIQYLASRQDIKIAFFSSGDEVRIIPFVNSLISIALGESRYKEMIKGIIICSSKQVSRYDVPYQSGDSTYYRREVKKDIRLAIAREDSLENAIYIDDQPGFVKTEQVGNYLFAETVRLENFEELGMPTTRCNNADDLLYRRVNAIFHVTGVLHKCLQNREREPIIKQLLALHWAPQNNLTSDSLVLNTNVTSSQESYQNGLAILQQFNAELTFNTRSSYHECIAQSVTELQRQKLDEAKEHEYEGDGCRLM